MHLSSIRIPVPKNSVSSKKSSVLSHNIDINEPLENIPLKWDCIELTIYNIYLAQLNESRIELAWIINVLTKFTVKGKATEKELIFHEMDNLTDDISVLKFIELWGTLKG